MACRLRALPVIGPIAPARREVRTQVRTCSGVKQNSMSIGRLRRHVDPNIAARTLALVVKSHQQASTNPVQPKPHPPPSQVVQQMAGPIHTSRPPPKRPELL